MPSRIATIQLVSSHREVYEPCDDSFALVDALLADRTHLIEHNPKVCMEIRCGSGYVITSLILLLKNEVPGVHYLATDTNPIATRVSKETLEAHGVDADVICADIASGLEKRLAGSVDVIVVNPPYVPTPEYEVGMEGIASAWAEGENGRTFIDKILPVVDILLSQKGWFYLVTLTSNFPAEICLMMRKRVMHLELWFRDQRNRRISLSLSSGETRMRRARTRRYHHHRLFHSFRNLYRRLWRNNGDDTANEGFLS